MKEMRSLIVSVGFLLLLAPLACGKKTPPPPPPPPSGAASTATPDDVSGPAPTIELSASPTSIEEGEQSTLNWNSSNASSVVIDSGVGNVAESGSITVSPRESTTYTATASGPGGQGNASTRVTVVPRSSDRGDIQETDLERWRQYQQDGRISPIYFAYDSAELSPEARETLQQNARAFRELTGVRIIIIEGHADERGTEEYNLALGDRRAQAAYEYLLDLGIQPDRLETISLGEERPADPGNNEAAWAKNRRAEFVPGR